MPIETIREMFLREAVSQLCKANVEKLSISIENNVLSAKFQASDGDKTAQLIISEIMGSISANNIPVEGIKDHLLSLINKSLLNKMVADTNDSQKKIMSDIKKAQDLIE